jgi:hypothetical protein
MTRFGVEPAPRQLNVWSLLSARHDQDQAGCPAERHSVRRCWERYGSDACDQAGCAVSVRLPALPSRHNQAARWSNRPRVPAAEIEDAVIKALQQHLARPNTAPADKSSTEQKIVPANIFRIEVRKDQLAVWLRPIVAIARSLVLADRNRDITEGEHETYGAAAFAENPGLLNRAFCSSLSAA